MFLCSDDNDTKCSKLLKASLRGTSGSAAVIDGNKRTSRIFVGNSIILKTDSRLSKGEDVVVCLP